MYIKTQTTNKSPILYIWCIYVANFSYRCFFLQVENLSLTTNLEDYCFYAMLITCKCMSFYKKLNCNTKSEPPYLATTLETIIDKKP